MQSRPIRRPTTINPLSIRHMNRFIHIGTLRGITVGRTCSELKENEEGASTVLTWEIYGGKDDGRRGDRGGSRDKGSTWVSSE